MYFETKGIRFFVSGKFVLSIVAAIATLAKALG